MYSQNAVVDSVRTGTTRFTCTRITIITLKENNKLIGRMLVSECNERDYTCVLYDVAMGARSGV